MEITRAYVKNILPHRDPEGHKGTFGKVYCLCGAVGYTGAPVLAASATVRSGSGLVYLGVPEDIWPVTAVKCQSAMPRPQRRKRRPDPEAAGCGKAAGAGRRRHKCLRGAYI